MLITSSTKDEINKIVSNISEVRKVEVSDVEVTNTEAAKIEATNVETKKEEIIKPKEIVSNKKEEQTKVEKKKEVKKAHQSVRVDLERIDKLMNMVSELVIYRTRLEQIVIDDKSQELVETLEQVERTTSELQELVMKIRMLPLDSCI